MLIDDELRSVMNELVTSTPEQEFERLGVYDHDGLRSFANSYAVCIVAVIEQENRWTPEEISEHLMAALLGGLLIGLEYARRKQEE